MSQFFIHPWMAAGGLALISIPIIIHLLNRMRYRTVRFAAMEFLLQSEQQNRRRLLFEQLLLLLLRILIVLAIVALFARLLLDPSQLALLEKPETHHLVVLDDSGSMRDRWGDTTAFDEALGTLKRLASDLASQGGNHSLTLLQTSQPDRSATSLTRRRVDLSLVGELEDKLETMQQECGYGLATWADVFPAIQRQLAVNKNAFQIVHVLSDFRASEWGNSPTLKAELKSLKDEQTIVNLVPTVPARHNNLAVTKFTGTLHTAAVKVPLQLTVDISNYGEAVVENVPVRVLIDDEPIPQSISIPQINAGESVQETFEVSIASAGEHVISVQISPDAIAADNTRYLTIDIPERQRILIADGSEQTKEADYVADALAADPQITGFEAIVIRPDSIRDQDLSNYAAVYLLNIDRLAPDVLKSLEDYVAAGGGIAWFMGDRVDSSFYNDLASRESEEQADANTTDQPEKNTTTSTTQAESLFPISIAASPVNLPRADDTNPGADLVLNDNPIFEILNAADGLLALFVNIYQHVPLAEGVEIPESVKVIGRLRDQSPLFLESRFGEGRVFISLTSAGPINNTDENRWHNWPFDMNAPGFTVFHLELAKSIANRTRTREPKLVNEPINVVIDPAVSYPEVRFNPPAQGGLSPTSITATVPKSTEKAPQESPDGEPQKLVAEYVDTKVPGVYRIVTEDLARESTTTLTAFNVPVSESEVEITTPEVFRRELAGVEGIIVQDFGSLEGLARDDPGRELRLLLLLVLVALFAGEQWLAYRLGFHSRNSVSSRGFTSRMPSGKRFVPGDQRSSSPAAKGVAS
ncbi:BatA domain-containing protein [uncultured Rubinisphaera sp.]|uniref:BatA domain-containing protein n=1 Tax=uncultured Rubinisphaera sp. TaxID=1678686 RepID=UPI0030D9103D